MIKLINYAAFPIVEYIMHCILSICLSMHNHNSGRKRSEKPKIDEKVAHVTSN